MFDIINHSKERGDKAAFGLRLWHDGLPSCEALPPAQTPEELLHGVCKLLLVAKSMGATSFKIGERVEKL